MSLNRVKCCLRMSIRLYHHNRRKNVLGVNKQKVIIPKVTDNPGIRHKVKMLQETDNLSELDDLDDYIEGDDYSEFESDFMGVGQTYDEHEREQRMRKERLKLQITKSRFMEHEKQPSFLTFAEKMEIQKLHKKDPVFWTYERLSESFPALPETIQKVIQAKWKPKTVERVQQYDQTVIENWECFRAGSLPLRTTLEKHLNKFKDRKIIPSTAEYIKEHMLEPRMEFPKPRNYIFSTVIDKFIEDVKKPEKLLASETKSNDKNEKNCDVKNNEDDKKSVSETKASYKNEDKEEDDCTYIPTVDLLSANEPKSKPEDSLKEVFKKDLIGEDKKQKKVVPRSFVEDFIHEKHRHQTFEQFVQNSVERDENTNTNTEEAIVLRDLHQKLGIEKREKQKREMLELKKTEELSVEKEDESLETYVGTEMTEIVRNKEAMTLKQLSPEEMAALQTRVKKWIKLNEEDNNYPLSIKIPKGKYKKGMTYRFKDCYYDDDGEFLYRVPGIVN